MVQVPPLQCYDSINQPLPLHGTSIFVDHRGSSLGSIPAWLLEIWPTSIQRQDSFDTVGEARVLPLFKRLHVFLGAGMEWTQKNPKKSTFSGVIMAFSGRKTSESIFFDVVICYLINGLVF